MIRDRHFHGNRGGFLSYASILIMGLIAALAVASGSAQEGRATTRIKRPLIYQMGNVVRINAEGARPLVRVLEALHERYGWNVDYEDPPYAEASVNPPGAAGPGRRQPRAANRANGMFSVEFKVGAEANSVPDEKDVLTTIVSEYNARNGAQFELRREMDGVFAVIGLEAGVKADDPERQAALDIKITLATKRRTTSEAIAAICQKINEQSRVTVDPSRTETDPRLKEAVTVGGTTSEARGLLGRALVTPYGRLNWRLLFEAGGYKLSVFAASE